ncbi:MAG: hypothetical protein NVS3B20_09950 [Polyangiales bacterium]
MSKMTLATVVMAMISALAVGCGSIGPDESGESSGALSASFSVLDGTWDSPQENTTFSIKANRRGFDCEWTENVLTKPNTVCFLHANGAPAGMTVDGKGVTGNFLEIAFDNEKLIVLYRYDLSSDKNTLVLTRFAKAFAKSGSDPRSVRYRDIVNKEKRTFHKQPPSTGP